jgi:hypothetical protein
MRRSFASGVIAVLQRNSWRFSSKETIDGRHEHRPATRKIPRQGNKVNAPILGKSALAVLTPWSAIASEEHDAGISGNTVNSAGFAQV